MYVRLLTEDMRPWDGMSKEERELELGAIEDLIEAGYMAGRVISGASGIPEAASVRGPTLAEKNLAEEQQEVLERKSILGRIKAGSVLFIGWIFGVFSATIAALTIWYFTH